MAITALKISDSAGDVEVTTGWTQDDGRPETREPTVVVIVSSEDDVRELVRHMTPLEAEGLSSSLMSTANRVRRMR
jgi:FAD/FMN-containing dehydrogenase